MTPTRTPDSHAVSSTGRDWPVENPVIERGSYDEGRCHHDGENGRSHLQQVVHARHYTKESA